MQKLVILMVFTLSFSLFSLEFNTVFPKLSDSEIIELEENSYLLNSDVNYKDGFKLIPDSFEFKEKFLQSVENFNPDLCVEMLYIFDKPELEGDELTKVLQENILAVSDQVGIEYFSHNRGKMHPLIKKSYHVNGIADKKKIDDPKITVIKENRSFTTYQKDTTFGGNYYSLLSKTKGGEIWNQQDNLKKLTVFGIYKVLDNKSLRVSYVIKPYEDKVIMYSIVQVIEPPKVRSILGFKVNIADSTRKRIGAILEWYIKRIEGLQ